MTSEARSGSGFDASLEPPSFRSVSLVRVFVFLWESLLTPVRLGADAALSLIRHARLELHEFIRALSRSSLGAEMKTEVSPRVLVFSSDCLERNAVSMATFRHSVMTGVCVCTCGVICYHVRLVVTNVKYTLCAPCKSRMRFCIYLLANERIIKAIKTS